MFYWNGCDVTFSDVTPTFCEPHPGKTTTIGQFRSAIERSLDLFGNNSADLSVVYFESIDDLGHRYGPDSVHVKGMVKQVDRVIETMLREIETRHLDDDINVMVLSDHGMTDVSLSKVVNISDVINMDNIEVIINNYGSSVYIWPKNGKEQTVYASLENTSAYFKTFLRKDIPPQWHFQHNNRIPDILLVAQLGWYIDTPSFGFYYYDNTGAMRGEHGFDVTESDMAGLFVAMGPDFRTNVKVDKLNNVNLYQVMCGIIGVGPRPHNGSWSDVVNLVADISTSTAAALSSSSSSTTTTTTVVLVYILCTMNNSCF
ncbi:glycerophosphocholine cholinephosphodiesterase ENPP6-like [Gigantopelta aegis]|uniref:glycerophosphocholine cholinephosphodiesterase ENPP6-like n=1 Tax=Gigantopelta aegis TaxID=1735272 RepID=UPI001B88913C|nr:glycerophosphocholine cholinephosphodiesterase ENPP6-like [Gigantopelta aegis]